MYPRLTEAWLLGTPTAVATSALLADFHHSVRCVLNAELRLSHRPISTVLLLRRRRYSSSCVVLLSAARSAQRSAFLVKPVPILPYCTMVISCAVLVMPTFLPGDVHHPIARVLSTALRNSTTSP